MNFKAVLFDGGGGGGGGGGGMLGGVAGPVPENGAGGLGNGAAGGSGGNVTLRIPQSGFCKSCAQTGEKRSATDLWSRRKISLSTFMETRLDWFPFRSLRVFC